MIRRILITIALLALPSITSAREAFHGWCELGNQSVVTQGLSSTTKAQQSNPQCVVTVFVHGGGLATIYSDNNGTVLANPFQAALNGLVIFYANDGRYDIQFSPGTTYLDWLLCDPFTPGAVCSGASSGAHNLLSTTHLDTIPFSPPVRGDLITAQNLTSPTSVNPSWARLPLGTNGQVLLSNGVDALWGNLTAGTGITITNNTGSLTISSSGGGSGCTLPSGGVSDGVLEENPKGTCDDSGQFTWNKANARFQVGNSTFPNTNGTNNTYIIGSQNILTGSTHTFVLGDNLDTSTGSFQKHIYSIGDTSSTENLILNNAATLNFGSNSIGDFTHTGSGGTNNVAIGFNNVANGKQTTSIGSNDIGVGGAAGTQQNGFVLGGQQIPNCVAGPNSPCGGTGAGAGSSNGFGLIGDDNLVNNNGTGTANSIYLFGFDNRADTTLGNISTGGAYEFGLDNEIDGSVGNDVVIGGASNTSHTSQVASCLGASDSSIWGALNVITGSSNFHIFGAENTVTSHNCVGMYGMNMTATANNTAYYGMSPNAGLRITASNGLGTGNDTVSLFPQIFSHYPACAAGTEGSYAAITDSSTNTWGATITGSSTNHVLGYCDGTNWTVAGK